jgi:preprotein translocase subunit YajC
MPLGLLAAMQLAASIASILAAESDDGGGNILVSLIPFLLIGVVMYLLLIRPQRKRVRDQADLQRSVGVGDEVVTTTGIYGFITGEDGPQRFWLEIDDNVQIRISRAAVQQKVDTSVTDDEAAEKSELAATDDPIESRADDIDEIDEIDEVVDGTSDDAVDRTRDADES